MYIRIVFTTTLSLLKVSVLARLIQKPITLATQSQIAYFFSEFFVYYMPDMCYSSKMHGVYCLVFGVPVSKDQIYFSHIFRIKYTYV